MHNFTGLNEIISSEPGVLIFKNSYTFLLLADCKATTLVLFVIFFGRCFVFNLSVPCSHVTC